MSVRAGGGGDEAVDAYADALYGDAIAALDRIMGWVPFRTFDTARLTPERWRAVVRTAPDLVRSLEGFLRGRGGAGGGARAPASGPARSGSSASAAERTAAFFVGLAALWKILLAVLSAGSPMG